jgi:hypothetical protein
MPSPPVDAGTHVLVPFMLTAQLVPEPHAVEGATGSHGNPQTCAVG